MFQHLFDDPVGEEKRASGSDAQKPQKELFTAFIARWD
jgi:hypothetical protein